MTPDRISLKAAAEQRLSNRLPQPPHSPLLCLPDELFHNNIFPHLFPDDVVVLGWVNVRLHTIASDNVYWRRRLIRDHKIPPTLRREVFPMGREVLSKASNQGTASDMPSRDREVTGNTECGSSASERPPGFFRKLYLGLQYPRVFQWGEWDPRLPAEPGALQGDVASPHMNRPTDVTHLFARPEGLHDLLSRALTAGMFMVTNAQNKLLVWGRNTSSLPIGISTMRDCEAIKQQVPPYQRVVRASTAQMVYNRISYLSPDGGAVMTCGPGVPGGYYRYWNFEEAPFFEPHWHGLPVPSSPLGETVQQLLVTRNAHFTLTESGVLVTSPTPLYGPAYPEARMVPPIPVLAWKRHPYREDENINSRGGAEAGGGASSDRNDNAEEIMRIALTDCNLLALKRSGEVWSIPVSEDAVFAPEAWKYRPDLSDPNNTDIVAGPDDIAVFRRGEPWPVSAQCGCGVTWQRWGRLPLEEWGDVPRPADSPIVQVAFSGLSALALAENGRVYSSGQDFKGSLARGEFEHPRPSAPGLHPPGQVMFPSGEDTVVFCIAENAALALGDGRLPQWLGRTFGDEARKQKGEEGQVESAAPAPAPHFLDPRPPPREKPVSKFNLVARTRNWWRDFVLLRRTLDEGHF